MKNGFIFITLILIIGGFFFVSLFRGSYANIEKDTINLDLFYNSDNEILKNNISSFIDLVDENIIINSSYNLSDTLNENYDFLTRFVISFILDNYEYFDIIYGEDYLYIDSDGREYTSNKYISLDTLYDITYKVFGVEYYYVLDRKLIVDDMLVLVDLPHDTIEMNIRNINYTKVDNNSYDIYVRYVEMEFDYVYRFNVIDDNRMIISNLSIEG